MDLVQSCRRAIARRLQEIERQCEETEQGGDSADSNQTQNSSEIAMLERDKNLDKILTQQAHLKRILDLDAEIKHLKKTMVDNVAAIDSYRKVCAQLGSDAIKSRQELLSTQANEVERYQLNQLKSIAEDYSRHQDILEQRKREIKGLIDETEREERERDAYLADVEKKLEKQLQERQRMGAGSGGLSSLRPRDGLTDELYEPNHIELTSVDEYAPYGAAPHSRLPAASGSRSGRGAGRGRARRRKN